MLFLGQSECGQITPQNADQIGVEQIRKLTLLSGSLSQDFPKVAVS